MLHVKVVLFSVIATLAIGAYSAFINDEHKPFFDGQQRIFGGYLARPGQFPHQASLRVRRSNNEFSHACGGSIVTNRFIVTAAHCFSAQTQENVTANLYLVLGAHNRSDSNDGVVYAVERIFIHPGWHASLIIHDVGLVHTSIEIAFTSTIRPIPISRQFVNTTFRAVTSGWGRTNDTVTTLKYAFMYTLTNVECRQRIDRANPPVYDYSTLCGYSARNGTGVCSGDSGGPLVFKGELIGITSWAYLCALGLPDGFCRVSEYVPWIEQQINATGTQPLP